MRSPSNPVYCGVDTTDLAQATRLIQSIAEGPRPAVGGIFLAVKATIVLGGVFGVSKLFDRFKAKRAEKPAGTDAPEA